MNAMSCISAHTNSHFVLHKMSSKLNFILHLVLRKAKRDKFFYSSLMMVKMVWIWKPKKRERTLFMQQLPFSYSWPLSPRQLTEPREWLHSHSHQIQNDRFKSNSSHFSITIPAATKTKSWEEKQVGKTTATFCFRREVKSFPLLG